LFVVVRRIRNNLFHGGKYPSGPEPDLSRDEKLLMQAIRILEPALSARPDLHTIFDDSLYP
jgi:hypothetical protein